MVNNFHSTAAYLGLTPSSGSSQSSGSASQSGSGFGLDTTSIIASLLGQNYFSYTPTNSYGKGGKGGGGGGGNGGGNGGGGSVKPNPNPGGNQPGTKPQVLPQPDPNQPTFFDPVTYKPVSNPPNNGNGLIAYVPTNTDKNFVGPQQFDNGGFAGYKGGGQYVNIASGGKDNAVYQWRDADGNMKDYYASPTKDGKWSYDDFRTPDKQSTPTTPTTPGAQTNDANATTALIANGLSTPSPSVATLPSNVATPGNPSIPALNTEPVPLPTNVGGLQPAVDPYTNWNGVPPSPSGGSTDVPPSPTGGDKPAAVTPPTDTGTGE